MISKNLRHALRIIKSLSDKPKRLEDIAAENAIPVFNAASLARRLARGGVIDVCKGPGGGYLISVRPSLYQVLTAITTSKRVVDDAEMVALVDDHNKGLIL